MEKSVLREATRSRKVIENKTIETREGVEEER